MFSHNLITTFLSLIRIEIFWNIMFFVWINLDIQSTRNLKPLSVWPDKMLRLKGSQSFFLHVFLSPFNLCMLWFAIFHVFCYKVDDVVSKIWLWSSNNFFLYFPFFRGRPKLSKKWYKRLKVCWILSFLLDLKLSTQGCHSKLLRLSYNCSKNLA